MIIDLFAGPGGWDEGLASIGRTDVLGIENDKAANATAEAAGHTRLNADIAYIAPHVVSEDEVEGLIASPPCPGFSSAGKGLGRKDFELLLGAIDAIGSGRNPAHVLDDVRGRQNDPRSALTLEPLRWALELEPEWIALEQVPQVLPLWQAYKPLLEAEGYSVWTANMHAEQYGVPQTRRRAVLMASRVGIVQPPVPTHSRYYSRTPDKLDEGVEKWVSLAEALGWVREDWMASPSGVTGPVHRPVGHPAATVTGAGNYYAYDASRPEWAYRRPSTTIVGSFKPEIVAAPGYRTKVSRQNAPGSVQVTVEEAGLLQSFRQDYPWQGTKGKQFQQVGNAVPPLLAAHVLSALTGAALEVAA